MPKYSRPFICIALAAALFVSSLPFSGVKTAQACLVIPSMSLLELFITSDLAVIAEVTNDEVLNPLSENESGRLMEVRKDLRLTGIYKGQAPEAMSFKTSEYIWRGLNEDGSNNGTDRRQSLIEPGNRYLLFFRRDKDTSNYRIVSNRTAIRKLDVDNETLYEKRLSEIAEIAKDPKDQLPEVTEWLVKLLEEPATRFDGLSEIRRSFNILNDPDWKLKDGETKSPFSLENFSSSISGDIARSLSDSQKQRISAVLDAQIADTLGPDDAPFSIDATLAMLVREWNFGELTIRANAYLHNLDPADENRVLNVMSLITIFVEDGELGDDQYRYREAVAEREIEEEEAESYDADPPANAAENEDENDGDENEVEKPVQPEKAANAGPVTPEPVETAEAKKLRFEGLKIAAFRKFKDRYQYLLARGFPEEEEGKEERRSFIIMID